MADFDCEASLTYDGLDVPDTSHLPIALSQPGDTIQTPGGTHRPTQQLLNKTKAIIANKPLNSEQTNSMDYLITKEVVQQSNSQPLSQSDSFNNSTSDGFTLVQ